MDIIITFNIASSTPDLFVINDYCYASKTTPILDSREGLRFFFVDKFIMVGFKRRPKRNK